MINVGWTAWFECTNTASMVCPCYKTHFEVCSNVVNLSFYLYGIVCWARCAYSIINNPFFSSTFSHVEDPLQLDEVIESFENYQVNKQIICLNTIGILSVCTLNLLRHPSDLITNTTLSHLIFCRKFQTLSNTFWRL